MHLFFGIPEFADWVAPFRALGEDSLQITIDTVKNVDNTVDLIIPIQYDQMRYVIENKNMFHAKILVSPTYDSVDILANKCKFADFIIAHNLQDLVPTIFLICTKEISPVTYPAIFKLDAFFGGFGSKVCHVPLDLTKAYAMAKCQNVIVQEYIVEPTEYSGHLLVVDGKVRWRVYYKMVHSAPFYIQRGRMHTYTRENIDYAQELESIFMPLNYTGVACVDFKIIDNKIKIFEINPRFGGTLVHNKKDFADMITFIKNIW